MGDNWIAQHWFDLLQSLGIISGFLFTAYSIRKEDKSRRIGNMLAFAQQHRNIWTEFLKRQELSRVIEKSADLDAAPVTNQERLFVTMLILHLDSVHRAMKAGMYVKLEGLGRDIKEFFSLPIPSAVWELSKPLQDSDFVAFVESFRSE